MDFTELYQELKKHTDELNELRRQFQEKMKGKFTELTAKFFEAAPEVQAVVWNQYTPYFNDGEECVFSVGEIYFVTEGFDPEDLNGAYEYEDDDTYKTISTYSWRNDNHPRRELCIQFQNFINSNEDLMEEIFGDHCTVYLTPNASISEEYHHD